MAVAVEPKVRRRQKSSDAFGDDRGVPGRRRGLGSMRRSTFGRPEPNKTWSEVTWAREIACAKGNPEAGFLMTLVSCPHFLPKPSDE